MRKELLLLVLTVNKKKKKKRSYRNLFSLIQRGILVMRDFSDDSTCIGMKLFKMGKTCNLLCENKCRNYDQKSN